jgi:hypothetical protein
MMPQRAKGSGDARGQKAHHFGIQDIHMKSAKNGDSIFGRMRHSKSPSVAGLRLGGKSNAVVLPRSHSLMNPERLRIRRRMSLGMQKYQKK